MIEIRVPRENANDDKVKIIEIFAQQHSHVNSGEVILEFETSKAIVELETTSEGIISLCVVDEQTVSVGDLVAVVSDEIIEFDDNNSSKEKPEITLGDENNINISNAALKLISKNNLTTDKFAHLDFVTSDDVEKYLSERIEVSKTALQNLDQIEFKNDDVILYGAGLQCQVVLDLIKTENLPINIVCIVDSNPKGYDLDGVPILNKLLLKDLFSKGARNLHICIGNGKAKNMIADEITMIGFKLKKIISKTSHISLSAKLGEGVFIGPYVVIGRDTAIGDLCQINHCVSIAHHCSVGIGVFFADGARIGGTVKIQEFCDFGINVSVNRGLTIGKEASFPSGSVITSNVKDGKKFKFRKKLK